MDRIDPSIGDLSDAFMSVMCTSIDDPPAPTSVFPPVHGRASFFACCDVRPSVSAGGCRWALLAGRGGACVGAAVCRDGESFCRAVPWVPAFPDDDHISVLSICPSSE